MRKRILATIVVPLALIGLIGLADRTSASMAEGGVALPLRAILVAQATSESAAPATSASPQTGGRSWDALAAQLATMPLAQARERHRQTQVALALAEEEKDKDDLRVEVAGEVVAELQDEAAVIAETTVANAIAHYRRFDVNPGLLEVTDLNEEIRARALGEAALTADTTTFDRFNDKSRDLQVAEYRLQRAEFENQRMALSLGELKRRHQAEQVAMVSLEERALWDAVYQEWTAESLWLQQLGSKQGAYFLTCPVDGPHEFIDSWGFPRSGGRRHKGVDILAPTGTPLVAPVSGRVEFRSNRVGGRSFHLTDEKGNYFYGTHLSAYGDNEGEVRAGQVIGYVGDDGNAAGIPHLHLEIHPGGRGNPINPFADSAAVCDGAMS